MKKRLFIVFAYILALGLLLPARGAVPVENATNKDWHMRSFWYSPWGKSGVHKGIDIFAAKGTRVISSSYGLVVYTGNIAMGGNVVAVLGPKWRIYYYAHWQNINANTWVLQAKATLMAAWAIAAMQLANHHICITVSCRLCPTRGAFQPKHKAGKKCLC